MTGKKKDRKRGKDDESGRNNRAKAAKIYNNHSDDEDETLVRRFDVLEKVNSQKFPRYFVKELRGEEFTVEFCQRTGFQQPIFIKERNGLHMTIPDSSFSVTDVKNMVGGKRLLDVMDCSTQMNSEMTLKDWEEWYTEPDRDGTKLNVISLEFSHTKLENYVSGPRTVRQIDWTDNVWPVHLKEEQDEGTNSMLKMKYPKVQKYCLMSVGGCYTDFHIDFGGTSVWYHIVRGQKVFWLIPPTDENLKKYEEWTLSGKQADSFFGDLVDKCARIVLREGNTFLIPSGWIHAVYTPVDSLVFGGNFLHSYSIECQIRCAQIEEAIKVPHKFRYPFFTELQWYALDKYVYALLGRTHLKVDDDAAERLWGTHQVSTRDHVHLTPQELFGIKAIIMFIHALPVTRKSVPLLIQEPIKLIRDVRSIVDSHKQDNPDKSYTGKPLLYWPGVRHDKVKEKSRGKIKREKVNEMVERISCGQCTGCKARECGNCMGCQALPRGRCKAKICLQKLIPINIVCEICCLDGWYAETSITLVDRPPETNSLMECVTCKEVTHPTCFTDYGVEGIISSLLPNSWHCPRCMKFNPPPEDQLEDTPNKVVKSEGDAVSSKPGDPSTQFVVRSTSDQSKLSLRTQLADQILAASKKQVKQPSYVVRPPPVIQNVQDVYDRLLKNPEHDIKLELQVLLPVLRYLPTLDVVSCGLVCKAWHTISLDPSLWTSVDLTARSLTNHLLSTTVQKQPVKLILDWTNLIKAQLSWLLPRLPQTRSLSVVGLEFNLTVSALATCNCPVLQELNLSYVANLTDAALHKLLTTPRDSRPGLLDKKSRLKNLRKLSVRNTEVGDISLRYMTQYLPHLVSLSLGGCWKLTNDGLAMLGQAEDTKLTCLDISGCRGVTDAGLEQVKGCDQLVRIECGGSGVTTEGMNKFVSGSRGKLKVYGTVIEKKHASHSASRSSGRKEQRSRKK